MSRLIRCLVRGADARVLPVVPITFLYNASFSAFWVYVGVFTLKGLHWQPHELGRLFLLSAPPAAVANYLSGRIADRIGRKLPIVTSFLAAATAVGALALWDSSTGAAFALIIALGVAGAPADVLDTVLVADLVPDADAREAGYATIRLAANLGAFTGPPLVACVIGLGGWTAFLATVSGLGVAGAAATVSFLPSQGRRAAAASGQRDPSRARDRAGTRESTENRGTGKAFLLLLVSTLLGYVVYCGYETVLPVIAVSDYRVAPATWGFLVMISPLMVLLSQLRLTRATARIPAPVRLAAALCGMGAPFLLLTVVTGTPVIAAVVAVFTAGEMLWMPTFQSVAARLAPAPARGRYLGALGAMTGPAWTLTPWLALTIRAHAGPPAVWSLLAATALAAATTGAAAARRQ